MPRGLVQLVSIPPVPNQQATAASSIAATVSALVASTAGITNPKILERTSTKGDIASSNKPTSNTKGVDTTGSATGAPQVHPGNSRSNVRSPLKSRDANLAGADVSARVSEIEATTSNSKRTGVSNLPGKPNASRQ